MNREILNAALVGLEAQRERLHAQIAQLRAILGPGAARTPRPAAGATTGKRRRMSAAGRARIGAAAKKRWAEYNRKKAQAARTRG